MRKTLIGIMALACLAIYLFVTAPAPLVDTEIALSQNETVSVFRLFEATNSINHAARSIYTERVVGASSTTGLQFGEDWADPGVEKGPLPALFLRLTAARMETRPERLGLYLGSDAPIDGSNLFEGEQSEAFKQVKRDNVPVFSTSSTGDLVAMYPDVASAKPCVTCHNEHPDSPRSDWRLNEIMGATTWTYPRVNMPSAEALAVTEAFYNSVTEAYQLYLQKAENFTDPIEAGPNWPTEGSRILPDADTFMAEVRSQAGRAVFEALILGGGTE